jgi:osmotically-inducible protein OsmY
VDITIESVDGRVVLSGIVADDAEKQAAQHVAAAVAGVKAVDNQLHAITDAKHFPTNRR